MTAPTAQPDPAQTDPEPQAEADGAPDAPEPRKTPVWAVVGVTLGIIGVAIVFGLVVSAGEDAAEYQVSDVSFSESTTGRVEATFTVANVGGDSGTPKCTIRAEDADGYRVGQDIVTGQTAVAAGESERYRGVTGIDMEGVSRISVEC